MPCILSSRSMMTMAAIAGSCRMAYLPQLVIAQHIGHWLHHQAQGLGGSDRSRSGSAIDQSVQNVQDVCLAGSPGLQRQLNCCEHCLLIVVKNQGQDLTISRSPPRCLSSKAC